MDRYDDGTRGSGQLADIHRVVSIPILQYDVGRRDILPIRSAQGSS